MRWPWRDTAEALFVIGDFKDILTDVIIDGQDGHNTIAEQLLRAERVFAAIMGMMAKQVYRPFGEWKLWC